MTLSRRKRENTASSKSRGSAPGRASPPREVAVPQGRKYGVPSGLRSGIYAVHLQHGKSEHYVPFFVAPPKGVANAPTAFLVPTTTYLAYTNWTRNCAQLERYPAVPFDGDEIDSSGWTMVRFVLGVEAE